MQFLISVISIHLYLWLLLHHLGNILSQYLSVVYELGGCGSELRAARHKMATGAMQGIANEQQKIIFKGALKINCAVPLTQSHKCNMVKFQRHIPLLSSWYLMSTFFFMDSKLRFRCCLGVQASNYVVTLYVTHLQLLSWSLFIQTQKPGRI